MLKSCCALLFLLFPCAAAAQYPGDEYYPYAEREERRELLTTDSTLFYRAVQSSSDLYGLRTGFNLPQVALRRRGLDYTLERTSLMGVAVSYRYLAALRLLGAEEQRYAGLAAAPGEPAAGAKAAVSASPGDGWRISAALDARSGRDMHVEGVFTNAVTAGLRLARRFGEGHELSVLCIVPPSVRGTRLSSSEEAFTLTGDRLYNPAWGWQDGRVRNSRVRRETVPLALAAYAVPLSASTSFAAGFNMMAGIASTDSGIIFVSLVDFADRKLSAMEIAQKLTDELYVAVPGAECYAFIPPSIPGLGITSGVSVEVQDLEGRGTAYLLAQAGRLMDSLRKQPSIASVTTQFNAGVPQRRLRIDKEQASTWAYCTAN